MRVSMWHGNDEFTVEEAPDPTPGPEDLVVEVDTVGICGTDVHITKGLFPSTPPAVLGHEFSGVIVAVGSEIDASRVGESVVCDISTHCFECIEACPKDVKPMDAIMELRTETLERQIVSNPGTRHIEAFSDSVVKSGWLNETTLALRSIGWFNIIGLMRMIPLGVRMLLRGKMPSPIHRPIPGVKRVRQVAKRFLAQQKDYSREETER